MRIKLDIVSGYRVGMWTWRLDLEFESWIALRSKPVCAEIAFQAATPSSMPSRAIQEIPANLELLDLQRNLARAR
jgi:hypothetical protein